MTDDTPVAPDPVSDPLPESVSEDARPTFMGPVVVVGEPDPSVGSRIRSWMTAPIAGALAIGIGLGIGGTLFFTRAGSDQAAPPTQAAAGPAGQEGAGTVITLPQVGSDDPAAFGSVDVTGTALPRLDGNADTAVGTAAPEVRGFDFAGNPVEITDDGRAKIVLLVAHWCPYCQQEIPVVRDWIDTTTLPDGVDVYSVVTLTDFTRGNYPPQTWLVQEAWNVPVIVDDDLDTVGNAFGLNAVPFWVFINADGTIAGRAAGGGVPAEALDSIAQELSASAADQ
ncbi:MAG: TlpA family protein disulfide reductase [Acidimicrobiia bacterium]|nr:TlpA family protein disulfide reductase [Acidimicrobiia bacterium]